jgi:hypothetical protein
MKALVAVRRGSEIIYIHSVELAVQYLGIVNVDIMEKEKAEVDVRAAAPIDGCVDGAGAGAKCRSRKRRRPAAAPSTSSVVVPTTTTSTTSTSPGKREALLQKPSGSTVPCAGDFEAVPAELVVLGGICDSGGGGALGSGGCAVGACGFRARGMLGKSSLACGAFGVFGEKGYPVAAAAS